jgi:hypothetical protein
MAKEKALVLAERKQREAIEEANTWFVNREAIKKEKEEKLRLEQERLNTPETKTKIEYLWVDGGKPTQTIRGRTYIVKNFNGKLEGVPR